MFEAAQEILKKRSARHNKSGTNEMYSRKHAYSSLCTCGYCGATLIRRKWHSGTNHEKFAWQCSNGIKNGRKACHHSKAIDEKTLEEAFVKGYNRINTLDRDAINEFIDNVENALDIPKLKTELEELAKQIDSVEVKSQKLVDLRLENAIDLDIYNKKYDELKIKHNEMVEKKKEVQQSFETEKSIFMRIKNFKKAFNSKIIMDEFDRLILDAIVEKVVVGAIDKEDNPSPYSMVFLLKAGLEFNDEVLEKLKQEALEHSHVRAFSFPKDDNEYPYSFYRNEPCGRGFETGKKVNE